MTPRLILALALAALPAALRAQSITVVANRGMRPTAVLGPHLRYVIAGDTDGAVVLSELSIPPVAFSGTVRIEGAQPGARAAESRPFADTVRFEADGRVSLMVADAPLRPPLLVRVVGSRQTTGGRISITAPRWPIGRVLIVTFAPADIYELVYRSAGLGVRDRMRVDNQAGFAFLTDSSTGPTTVAIGFGMGSHGRFQADVSSIVVPTDAGGRERRTVGAISMILEPERDDNGYARAEVVFGVGNSEAEAVRAARTAQDEPQTTPRAAALTWRTPSPETDLLLKHIMPAAGWMLDWDVLDGQRPLAASSDRPVVSAENAWFASAVALQRGDTAAVCGSYRLLRSRQTGGPVRAEVALRLGSRGRYLYASDSLTTEADAAIVLLAYACYGATRDAAMLRADYPSLVLAARRAAQAQAPPELAADAVERLAELDDELSRLSSSRPSAGDSLRLEAGRLAEAAAAPPAMSLWRAVSGQGQRAISREYGRLSSGADVGGLSLRAAGELIGTVGELFGVSEYLDRLEIAPMLDSIAPAHAWQLDGWLLGGGDTLGITYRPADRAAELRITAAQRHRIVLRFPWMSGSSCVAVRRGPDAERLSPVAQADGSFYVDVRAAFDPAVIRISASPCAGP